MSQPPDKIILGGALAGGLLFFGFLTSTCNTPFSKKNHASSEPVKQPDTESAPIINPSISNEKLRNHLVSQNKKHIGEINLRETKIRNLEKQLTVLNHKHKAYTAKVKKLTDIAEIGSIEGKFKDLVKQNKTLEDKLQQAQQEHQTQINTLKKQMANTGAGDADSKLKEQSELLASLKKQLVNKDTQITMLNAQVNQFKSLKNTFVKSTNDLPKNAQNLLADIKALEGKSLEETKAAYAQFAEKHHATSIARIKFSTGSANLSKEDQFKIMEFIVKSDSNAYFLITGYADKSGDASTNKKLSSERATAVAKEFSKQAKGFQAAQAVYLGQTDRFGPEEENRVVEIWKIK